MIKFVGEAAHVETVVEVTEVVVLVGKVLVADVVNGREEVVITAGFRAWSATPANASLKKLRARTNTSVNCMLI